MDTVESDTSPRPPAVPIERWELALLALFLLILGVIGAVTIARRAPLFWDEAVYSLRVRDIVVGDVEGFYWSDVPDVRASGLPLLLAPFWILFGGTDVVLRSGALLLAMGAVGLTWWEARLLFTRRVALVAAAIIALAAGWSVTGWQVVPDIAGATVSLAAVVLLTAGLARDRAPWWILGVAPLAGLATAVRYGSPLLLAPALVAITVLYWSTVRRSVRIVIATALASLAGVLTVWFVPSVTGAERPPVMAFLDRQEVKAVPIPDRLQTVTGLLPDLFGPVVGIAIVLGLAAAVIGVRRREIPFGPMAASAAITLAVSGLLIVGIARHQLRYLAPVMPFLAIMVAAGLAWAAKRLPLLLITTWAILLIAIGGWHSYQSATDGTARITNSYSGIETAARQLDDYVDRCVIVSPNPQQAAWYSGCDAVTPLVGLKSPGRHLIGNPERLLRLLENRMDVELQRRDLPLSRPVFVIVGHRRKPRPVDAALSELEDLAIDKFVTKEAGRVVTVYELGPANQALDEIRRRRSSLN